MREPASAEDRRRAWVVAGFLAACALAVGVAVYLYTLPSVSDLPKTGPTPTAHAT